MCAKTKNRVFAEAIHRTNKNIHTSSGNMRYGIAHTGKGVTLIWVLA